MTRHSTITPRTNWQHGGNHAEVLTSNQHYYFANCGLQQPHREYQCRRRESEASRQLVRRPTRQSRSACML
jgi:hypothetical protein